MWMLTLRFPVSTHRHGELMAFLARAKPYYEQPGGIRVRLLQGVESPEEFLEIVEYRDQDAYERDQERVAADPGMKALLEEWRGLHSGPLIVEAFRELTVPRPSGGAGRPGVEG
jgi:quinol monooxygenase YgiN